MMFLPLEIVIAIVCLLIGLVAGRWLWKDGGRRTTDFEQPEQTDALTGLANRTAFDEEIDRRLSEWRRQQSPVSLMLVDMDRFRRFNDNHGHPAGDELLRCVADALVDTMRTIDLVARFGGEKMAVVMPHTNWHEAVLAAERARLAIEKTRIKSRGQELGVTVSVGLAEILPSDNASSLVQRADEALHASKQAGRNLTHRHDGDSAVRVSPSALEPAPTMSEWPGMPDPSALLG